MGKNLASSWRLLAHHKIVFWSGKYLSLSLIIISQLPELVAQIKGRQAWEELTLKLDKMVALNFLEGFVGTVLI